MRRHISEVLALGPGRKQQGGREHGGKPPTSIAKYLTDRKQFSVPKENTRRPETIITSREWMTDTFETFDCSRSGQKIRPRCPLTNP